jgi:hypothetical protein
MMAGNATHAIWFATKVHVDAFAKGHALFPLYPSPRVNENKAIANVAWVRSFPFVANLLAVGIFTYACILYIRHGGMFLG